ncbi:hypothetical protein DOY81_015182, partial [Sarcophaga bullata]
DFFARLRSQYGKAYHLWAFHHLIMIVEDQRYFEAILGSATLTRKPFIYDMFSIWLGEGLLISSGRKWHARRKILTPTYHFKILEEFVEVFDKESDVLVRKLASKADGKTAFDVFPIICLTALDIISETAMGISKFSLCLGGKRCDRNFWSPYCKPIKSLRHNISIDRITFIF